MWRISSNKRAWRIGLLLLLLVALTGPWAFDKIHVPAEYPCDGSNTFRLDGDFCGIQLSGLGLISFIATGLVSISMRLVTGATAFTKTAREFLFVISSVLLLLPFISSLLLIVRGEQRRRRRLHVAALCLALCLAAGFILLDPNHFSVPLRALWGIWFYICLLICALAIELLTLLQERSLISAES
jgi:hypothetical protein